MISAVGLISGGLDSALAVRLVQEQGILVIGLSCRHPFHPAPPPGRLPHPRRVADELGIELVQPDVTANFLALLKNPAHGYGKHLNPCVDCRLLYLKEGEKLMKERGAGFLITGEVLGQRPMSQRRDSLDIIDRDSGLRGLILRPLSAKLLRPTVPEEKGWVDRDQLLALSGRSRRAQLELAEKLELTEFSSPAGGCLLTMEDFARKMQDLIRHTAELRREDVELLKVGRHFRLSPRAVLAVGKNDAENRRLLALAQDSDLLLTAADLPGPLGLLRGPAAETEIRLAAALVGRYVSKARGLLKFSVQHPGRPEETFFTVSPLSPAEVEKHRI